MILEFICSLHHLYTKRPIIMYWVELSPNPFRVGKYMKSQTRSNPLPQFIARLRSLLRTSLDIQVCVVRLVVSNNVRGVREDRLATELAMDIP